MAPEKWAHVRRLLAVRLDNIGDVIMLGPSLRCLREALPELEITLLASPAGSQAAPLMSSIDEVIVHSALWQQLGENVPLEPNRQQELIQTLRRGEFDAAIIFTSFSQSPHAVAYACYLAGIPLRLGQSKEFGGAVLTQEVKPLPDSIHQVDRNIFLLESAGFSVGDRQLSLTIPDEAQRAADRLLSDIGVDPHAPFVLMAPGASCTARRYDLQRAAVVAQHLPRRTAIPLVIAGSPRERELLEPIIGTQQEGVFSIVGQTSIPELAAVVRRAALLITNNSGPLHIADALRRPMVVLYSGTEYESQWRPRSAEATLLNRPVPCSPCYNFDCPYNMECLDIPPEEVVATAVRLLQSETNAGVMRQNANTMPRQAEIRYEQASSFNQ